MNNRKLIRYTSAVVVMCAVCYIGISAVTGTESGEAVSVAQQQSTVPFTERTQIAPKAENITVMSGQGFGNRSSDALIAFAPDGRLLYYESRYGDYQDVDPVPDESQTVLFTATEYLSAEECNAETECARDVIATVNLTTGEREILWSHTFRKTGAAGIHDVDRINETHLLVGGFYQDRIFILNHSSEMITWQYSFQQDFRLGGGGPFPGDWVHLNDVELLSDGTIMASARNQDQVVFIDRQDGLIENRTLGSEDDYSTLYEQHNPDYIPTEHGGPAVLVADSENYRIVEYQRINGEWRRTWTWQDDQMAWPRDADRLPNGNTLITDTHGGRLVEVNIEGEIVWQIEVKGLYEAERLGTGAESQGGKSASELQLQNQTAVTEEEGKNEPIFRQIIQSPIKTLVPQRVHSAILFVSPAWFGFIEKALMGVLMIVSPVWLTAEIYYLPYQLRSPIMKK